MWEECNQYWKRRFHPVRMTVIATTRPSNAYLICLNISCIYTFGQRKSIIFSGHFCGLQSHNWSRAWPYTSFYKATTSKFVSQSRLKNPLVTLFNCFLRLDLEQKNRSDWGWMKYELVNFSILIFRRIGITNSFDFNISESPCTCGVPSHSGPHTPVRFNDPWQFPLLLCWVFQAYEGSCRKDGSDTRETRWFNNDLSSDRTWNKKVSLTRFIRSCRRWLVSYIQLRWHYWCHLSCTYSGVTMRLIVIGRNFTRGVDGPLKSLLHGDSVGAGIEPRPPTPGIRRHGDIRKRGVNEEIIR